MKSTYDIPDRSDWTFTGVKKYGGQLNMANNTFLKSILGNLNIATKDEIKEQEKLFSKEKDGLNSKLKDKEIHIKTQEKLIVDLNEKVNQWTLPSVSATTEKERGSTQSLVKRYTPEQLLNLYLTNQFVFRGVNIRADEMVSRGYDIIDGDDGGRKKCLDLIDNSGGIHLFWLLSVNTDVMGDGYVELCWNKGGKEILRLDPIHPVTFGFKKDRKSGKIIIDQETKKPIGYEQLTVNNGKESFIDIPLDRVGHLVFNKVGDEFSGISILQPIYTTVWRLMNMEHSAAEAAVRTANPLWVGKVATKSPNELQRWGRVLGRIGGKNQILIPEHLELELMSPGLTNFPDYADYFLNSTVAGLGVPKPLLIGVGEGSNRAVSVVQTRHLYTLIEKNQLHVEALFNHIFKVYGEASGFKPPRLKFNEITQDLSTVGELAGTLYGLGLIDRDEARGLIGFESVPGAQKPKTGTGTQESDIKTDEMRTWHADKGGSQAGNKKEIKADPGYVPSPK